MTLHRQRDILLERDGVINRRVANGCVYDWQQFEFLPRALEALRVLAENNISTLVLSRQPGIAQGLATAQELEVVTRRFLLEVALAGGRITKVYHCTHGEWDECHCKSPRPGLVVRARAEHGFCPPDTYMVSESCEDLAAAAAVGCPGILLQREAFLTNESQRECGVQVASSLYDAVERIVLGRKETSEVAEDSAVRSVLLLS